MMRVLITAAVAALALAACGGGSDDESSEATPTPAAAQQADLGAIKAYLLEHTEALKQSTAQLQTDAEAYYELAKSAGFDYGNLLESKRPEVAAAVKKLQDDHIAANPNYEEMEGVVAGVPELADFDVILDAGADKSDPENAVPFSLTTPAGKKYEQPGNFFALIETSAYGTEPKFTAKGVKADLDGDGKVTFPEALPDADFIVTAARDMAKNANDLDAAARKWEPNLQDAFTAVVVMTPTMSEYFGAWKNSRFVAGDKADEKGFVAVSRLSDIRDILGGIVLIYDNIEPSISKVDSAQAQQTEKSLKDLHAFAERLLDEEQGGKKFTASDADTLGSEAQRNAEAIAGQVSQAAGQLGITLED
jgi:nitrous oxide reductase accessory protein NosL